MPKIIGITFVDECVSAGVSLDGVVMTPSIGGFNFRDDVSEERRAAILAVFDAHVPTIPADVRIDVSGFTQAVISCLGGVVAANQFAAANQFFFPAIQTGQWADMQALLIDAKKNLAITSEQYDAIKSAAVEFNIPCELL